MKARNKTINIAVCGSAAAGLKSVYKTKAYKIGCTIAERGCTLFTGATLGFSFEAVKGAHDVGGTVIGIAPAESLEDQLARHEKIDPKIWSTIIYTGIGYKMRDVVMVRSVDALIYIGGGVGTLLEMSAAVDYRKVMGILKGSGGATNLHKQIAKISHRNKPIYVIDADPKKLVDRVIIKVKKGN